MLKSKLVSRFSLIGILTLSLFAVACDSSPATLNDDGSINPGDTTDTDGDGILDSADNCVSFANEDQTDSNADGVGDLCDSTSDTDGDGITDDFDNCPVDINSDQTDSNDNGIGNVCDTDDTTTDTDGDGVADSSDNCPEVANADQADSDSNGTGNACDTTLTDTDQDGILDVNDNCIEYINVDQADMDSDSIGDACDTDNDNDGVEDAADAFPYDATETTDTDGDGLGNNTDNCTTVDNLDQADMDADGSGDECDDDIDGDGVLNTDDLYPTDPAESADTDADGFADNADNCDAIANADQIDSDGDGTGDACDDDQDGDGVANTSDNCAEASNADQSDVDGDTLGDVCDDDADGDTYTTDAGDCDDADSEVHPGATEVFNFKDDDCNRITDYSVSLGLSPAAITGENASDQLGKAVADAGDVNGDGLGDFLIGAPLNDDAASSAGKVYLIYGSATLTDIAAASANVTYTGEISGDAAGTSIASAGDVNNDGFADILIGAPKNDENGTDAGKVYLIYGSATLSSISLSAADVTFVGDNAGDNLGNAVAKAGDVNGDGISDILMGAYGNDAGGNSAGKVYLVYGTTLTGAFDLTSMVFSDGVQFVGENMSDVVGKNLNTGKDLDGDGFSDLVIGAQQNDDAFSNAGKIYVIYGSSTLRDATTGVTFDLSAADASFTGEAAGDNAGSSIAIGDVNGDGAKDLIVGAYHNNDAASYAGKVYLVLGTAGTRFSTTTSLADADRSMKGHSADDLFGYAVDSGDLNGDGYDDIVVGTPYSDTRTNNSGKVSVYLGGSALSSASSSRVSAIARNAHLATVIGENKDDNAGFSLAVTSDLNGDGIADLLIGAYNNDDTASGAGKAYVNFGATTE